MNYRIVNRIKILVIPCLLVALAFFSVGCSKDNDDSSRSVNEGSNTNIEYDYNTVYIFFNPNGGSVDKSWKAVVKGQKYGDLPTAMLTDCEFVGWYTDKFEGERITSDSVLPVDAEDLTLYARFESKAGQWKIDNLRYYYTDSEGNVPMNEWRYIDDYWYYFDQIGRAVMGWQTINDVIYYMDVDGKMATGWKRYNGAWYYFNEYPWGNMATEWQKIGDEWYYFDTTGKRCTGWVKVRGEWYFLDKTGVLQTGWHQIGGKTYYFRENGKMCWGICRIDGKVYGFDDDGALIRDEYIEDGYVNKDGIFEGNK